MLILKPRTVEGQGQRLLPDKAEPRWDKSTEAESGREVEKETAGFLAAPLRGPQCSGA